MKISSILLDTIDKELLPLLLKELSLDAEGYTLMELLEYLKLQHAVYSSFDDAVSIYSIWNERSGKRMSAPYRGTDGLQERYVKHLISIACSTQPIL